MKTYEVKGHIQHNKNSYAPGDRISVSEKDAERLIRLKAINGDSAEMTQPQSQIDSSDDSVSAADREKELNKMTVEQLKSYAETEGINLEGSTKKEDIITEILLHES